MDEGPIVGVHLRRTDENVREIAALDTLLGGPVGVDGVLADLNRQARRTFLLGRWRLGRAVDWGFAFDRQDRGDPRWWPQGISTSADASDTEDIGGKHVLVVSWYAKDESGVRVTFVDLASLRYRHVLLVVPVLDEHGMLVLRPLRVHAGGIVWNGPYLHVAATARGLMTCKVDDIMRVPDVRGTRAYRLGLRGQQVASYGYRYVLPVRFSYRAYADDGATQAALLIPLPGPQRRPARLVAGEYGRDRPDDAARALPPRARHPDAAHRRGRAVAADRRRRGRRLADAGRLDRRRPLPRHRLARPVEARQRVRRHAWRPGRAPATPRRWAPRTSPTGRRRSGSGRSASTPTAGGCSR